MKSLASVTSCGTGFVSCIVLQYNISLFRVWLCFKLREKFPLLLAAIFFTMLSVYFLKSHLIYNYFSVHSC